MNILATISWHVILIGLTFKFPRYFVTIHAPLLILLNYLSLINFYIQPISNALYLQNGITFSFYLICGLVLSGSWIFTALSIFTILVGNLIFLNLYLQIVDYGIYFSYILNSMIVIYGMYYFELVKKNDISGLKQIQKMN